MSKLFQLAIAIHIEFDKTNVCTYANTSRKVFLMKRKLISLLLAIVMLFAMAVPCFAESSYDDSKPFITIWGYDASQNYFHEDFNFTTSKSGPGWSWNASTATFTIENAEGIEFRDVWFFGKPNAQKTFSFVVKGSANIYNNIWTEYCNVLFDGSECTELVCQSFDANNGTVVFKDFSNLTIGRALNGMTPQFGMSLCDLALRFANTHALVYNGLNFKLGYASNKGYFLNSRNDLQIDSGSVISIRKTSNANFNKYALRVAGTLPSLTGYSLKNASNQNANVYEETATAYGTDHNEAFTYTIYNYGASKYSSSDQPWTLLNSNTVCPFVDVPNNAWYYNSVAWAVKNGIASGTSASSFGATATCTRAQAMVFLWSAAGRPEPTITSTSFDDVKSSSYYYKAVLWAVEKGITSGVSSKHFGSNDTVTRAQFVCFLYAAKGRPQVSNTINFSDVKSGAYYYNAVRWAVANGITSGTSATTFGPNDKVTRAQAVTFLYSAYGK